MQDLGEMSWAVGVLIATMLLGAIGCIRCWSAASDHEHHAGFGDRAHAKSDCAWLGATDANI
jgi:hypothetical protein